MKVLLVGGTKFIGKYISEEFEKNNDEVFFLNRGITSKNENTIICDIEKIVEKKDLILSHNFDIVVHCICNTEKNATDLVEIFKNTKTKLIILSSQDCYHAFQELVRGKNSSDYPIDEKSALTDIKYYYSHINSARDKYDKNLMTNILIDSYNRNEINLTIFRLPMVYGPYDYQFAGRHGEIIKRIIDKKENYIISASKYHSIWTFLYVENIADAILFSIDKDITNGKIYNLGETKVRSWKLWIDLYSKIANFDLKCQILPDEILSEKKELDNNEPYHVISSAELFHKDTGYIEKISIEEGIKRTFDYASKNIDILPKIDYEKEEKLLDKYNNFLKN
ncbi:MAG: NAD-dependent epimerase/dehydratase family protein [Cyanobacteriota bacterium]